jgi:excisionase family DNA binding protein
MDRSDNEVKELPGGTPVDTLDPLKPYGGLSGMRGGAMTTKRRTDLSECSPMMTVRETQAFLRLSRRLTYRVIKTKGFPAIRFGRAIRVPREALMAWIAAHAGT